MRFSCCIWSLFGLLVVLSIACSGSDAEEEGQNPPADGDLEGELETEQEPSEDGDVPTEDGDETEEEEEMDMEEEQEGELPPTDEAMIFSINPVATPTLTSVQLPVADDGDGSLISPTDSSGLRRIQVLSCLDQGETNTINVGAGPVTQRICTLEARANKQENGSFVYDDYTNAVNGVFDPTDRHAEVEAFYHASKFYDFFTRSEVGVIDRIPNRHGDDNAPISLIANFMLPTPEGSNALQPIHSAMYLPREHLVVGMAAIYGLLDLPGDVIVLGQGSRADFAYDGETVYHEMGHLMNRAFCGLGNTISLDRYGMSNLENALEQGLAETMTFLVSGRSGLFDYIDHVAGSGFFRDADNDLVYPNDYRGVDQGDAMILAGAMWETFARLEQEGVAQSLAVRWLLLTMQSLDAEANALDLSDWAEAYLAVLDENDGEAVRDAVETIFQERGLLETERARPVAVDETGFLLFIGGAYPAMWNDVLTLEGEGEENERLVSTALVQLKLAPAETPRSCSLLAKPAVYPSSMYPTSNDWQLSLLVRNGQAVAYEETASWQATVAFDEEVTSIDDGNGALSFPLSLQAGTTTYLHFINQGTSPMFLTDIRLVCDSL